MVPPTDRVQRYNLHGRRSGRPLRRGRLALVKSLLPRLQIVVPEVGTLDPHSLFDSPRHEIWLEIGFGGGEHLAWQAQANPDVGCIGCEPYINGVASLLAHIERRNLENIRIFPSDGRHLLACLAPDSIDRVFILFPDPWPKTRHHKRRLIAAATLNQLATVLRDGAELRFATDDVGYLRWTLAALLDHPDFLWAARQPGDWRARPDDWPETRYERKALARGRHSTYLRFWRRLRGSGQKG